MNEHTNEVHIQYYSEDVKKINSSELNKDEAMSIIEYSVIKYNGRIINDLSRFYMLDNFRINK